MTGYLANTIYRFAGVAKNTLGPGPESSARVMFYQCAAYFSDTGKGCKVRMKSRGLHVGSIRHSLCTVTSDAACLMQRLLMPLVQPAVCCERLWMCYREPRRVQLQSVHQWIHA